MLAVLVVVSTALAGCGFVGLRPPSVASVPGFFVGIWDGLIARWTLLLRAFLDIKMYADPNSGWWCQVVAMRISGHKTASVYRRYRIVAEDDLREALARTQASLAVRPTATVVPIRAAVEGAGR